MGTNEIGCQETTIVLKEKGSKGNKVTLDASFAAIHPKGDHDEMHKYGKVVSISKIDSALGLQVFLSAEADIRKAFDEAYNKQDARYQLRFCQAWVDAGSPDKNTILLDNYGTDKFYCKSDFQTH
jgi:hypothetical protein